MTGINIPDGSSNQFFGQKVSKAGKNVYNASDNDLIYKNDYSTQTFYNSNGSLSFGLNTDGTYGMQTLDPNGNILFEMSGETWYWYDPSTGKNNMQVGLLPDGTYGMAVAKYGYNVSDGIY